MRKPHLRKKSACMRNRQKVIAMAEGGAYLAEIARAVGTTGARVRHFLRLTGMNHLSFPVSRKGLRSSRWKGGRRIDPDGYVMILSRGHPCARKHTHYVAEHRLVMEQSIGRYLKPGEVVHHVNGNRADNRPENLQLFSANGEHLKHELSGRCPKWTADGLHRIRQGVVRAADLKRGKKLPRRKRDVQPLHRTESR